MKMFPCKKCPSCNVYSGINIAACECGADLQKVAAGLLDIDTLAEMQYGDIDISLPVFSHKCIACGTMLFTDDPAATAPRCHKCGGTRFQPQKPVPYVAEEPEKEPEPEAPAEPVQRKLSPTSPISPAVTQPQETPTASNFWGSLLGNSQQAASGIPVAPPPSAPPAQPAPAETPTPAATESEEEEEEVSGWGSILGNTTSPATPTPAAAPVRVTGKTNEITLTAIRFGQHSFTLQPDPNQSYLLGREAQEGSFLSLDLRVSGKHCYLFFRSGVWYVKDNDSSNGTAIDGKDIGLGGTKALHDGCLLKLGHHTDSMEFRVLIT